jgi:hypothetical protein
VFMPTKSERQRQARPKDSARFLSLRRVVSQMRIRVTQRDIDEGVQSNCFHCPVARAVKRVFKATEVWVREIIIVAKAGSQQTYVTPPTAVDFIERFDSAMLEFESPKPFSFTLIERVRPTLGGNRASKG